ncbi:MAG: PDDEXK nuclease domain-containing protein [Fibrobacter sp.]|nr:PDDEXK nuclease domain-containing protein [Fibrobacter sp.]MDY6369698.1 PDDEXK nuclease domain-containing protein [Fibrobacter sp.]MDY6389392.1 PDDEXK nuclease domain-containing protein [Fibrobacter sp.]
MNKRVSPIGKADGTTFENLAERVKNVHNATSSVAKGAVNQLLTIRNWAIGCYIVEYEQEGCDRAKYGARLLQNLADKLSIKGLDRSTLNICRLFYIRYPQICATVSHKLQGIDYFPENLVIIEKKIRGAICETASRKFETPPELLVTRLSFSHIKEILPIEDPVERFFYELECIKGTWNVRELRRQIDTKLYFRSGISKKPELLLQRVEKGGADAVLSIKDAYTLDFLDLNAKDEFSETELEQAIMDHLQEFLLEMGKGFCFEARQKRIIIDDEYYFIDLVLYNRLLHCNVIVELKVGKFRIEHAAQLNAYISYFKDCEMVDGDNPPIGILLCTEKGPKMVQYVLNGMDEKLFVSTYKLQLPDREQLENFLIKEVKEMGL